jgi:hypothetical protein
MIKHFLALLYAMLFFNTLFACDVCGAAGGNSLGILPGFKKHFIAARWSERSFVSSHTPSLSETGIYTSTKSTEHFNTLDIWGRFYAHKRVQLFVFVPFSVNTKIDAEFGTDRFYGLSDISLMTNYVVVNTGDSLTHKVKHNLLLGGGIKLPTGKYGKEGAANMVIPNMQLGTGSFDFLFNTIYNLRVKSYGINFDFNYRVNTVNRKQYQFGNKFNTSIKGFYWHNIQRSVLMPNAGFYFEHSMKDFKNGIERVYTGGYSFMATAGIDLYIRSFGIGFNFMQPIKNNFAQGYVKAQQRYTINLTYLF